MTLLKQEESAVLQVYEKYWDCYINGDVPTLASLLAEDYTQIGSVESEVFDNKKDAIRFIESTIDQITGKVEMRNRVKKIEPVDPFVLITELSDLYVLTEGKWAFYAKFRASSILQKKDDQWKFIHQHSSMPDIRADEGENIATEKITRENIELRDAIKRRTIELEQKNQELAMEASLERVRAMAMGMRKPDDLPGICEVLFNELRSMGFSELRNAMINIHNDEKSTFVNYDYSDEIGQSINHLSYTLHPVIEKQIKQIRSTHDAFSETVFRGQDLEDWKAFRNRIGEQDDPRIANIDALNYYFYSIGTGAIGISTFGPISSEKLDQLKRFRNVFEFAYRRYMDVAKAEAQAREAQIEASLERIRAASLAMQDSSALDGIIFQLYGELTKLDAKLDRCFIMIVNPENKGITWWMAGQEGLLADNGFFVQMNQHPSHLMYLDHCDKRKKKWTYLFGGKEKRDCDHFIFTQTELAKLPESIKAFMSAAKQVHLSGSSDQFGSIVTGSFEPLPDEQQEIISRFTIAFNQAYIRFLDLQKAEAQARETQIQLALERVRARTMAMQKSEELKEVAKELRVQLAALGTDELETCAINLYEESDDYLEAWVAVRPPDSPKEIVEFHFNIPKKGIIIIEDMLQAYRSGVDEYVFELGGSKGAQWMNTMEANMPEMFAAAAASESYKVTGEVEAWFTCDYFSGGALIMITMSPPQHESRLILKRFKQVFGLAYRRFADLKKAEAQARESQIEAVLERVRSRTMGMQKSDELKEVIKLVYQQLIHLKINLDHSGFVADYTPGGDWHFWIADELDIPSKITHPYFDSVWANQFNEAKEKGADFFATHLNFEEKNKFYNELLSYVPGLPEASKDFYLNCPGLAVSTVLFENISLYIENFAGIPYTDEENNTLMRFGKVFQQTYTRFLDLQKAEAQARESQIELGLERVRARAMAMQDSGELSDLVATLLHELTKLDFSLTFCIINIYNEPDHSNMVWAANPLEGKAPESYYMKFEDYPFHHAMMREWKARTPKYVYVMEGKEKEIYDDYLYTDTEFRRFPEEIQTANRALDRYVASFVFSQFGGLQTVGDKPLSNESLDILYRFGKVFDQTYTRFLDLQKAETQAKEARIEAALERVRSRSMAMHKSDELLDAGEIIFIEMQKLGIESLTAGFVIMDKEGKNGLNYAPNPLTKKIFPLPVIIPHDETMNMQQVVENWQKGKPFFIVEMDEDETIKHQTFIAERSTNFPLTAEELIAISPARLFLHNFYYKEGYILVVGGTKLSEEQSDIMLRFAKVFQQTYTRFLDLQKAEVQAREAKIEAALERVRAKAMAMHSSRDLQDTIIVFYRQLESFNITPKRCGVGILNKENTIAEVLTMNTTEKGDRVEVMGKLNLTGHPVLDGIYQHWLIQEEYHPLLRGNEIKAYYELIQPHLAYPDYSSDIIQYGYFFYFHEGGVFIWTSKELNEDELTIHRRFTSVLSLAYRRYKDLQQAESLAKEATIEAALEKVRGKAMAMHNSNDLLVTAGMVFTELRKLDVTPMRCGVSILNKTNRNILLYSATASEDGDQLSLLGSAVLADHPILAGIYDHWILGEDYFPVMEGEILNAYYEKIKLSFAVPASARKGDKQFGYFLVFSEGMFYGWSDNPFTEEEINILHRFKSIIDLTFRRYIELKKSEANALDAIRRASLDRVRAETASMRTTADLEKITPLIWNELSTLNVPFIRCGVFIMDEAEELIHTFLSTPDGKAIASFHLPYHASADLWETVVHWREKEKYQQHWDEAAFVEWTGNLVQQGFISSADSYATEHRPTNLYLHFLPFMQGMLYVGNDAELNENDLHLVQNLADAFSTAYARYEDFNRLEAAKEQVDKALTDLKQAQSQLVQAEKMASLGELTAGIAHEIQNPLNFVNNFSEINTELSEEIVVAARKGDLDEIILLAADIKSNQDKISEHGKRADAIVKGMLQHSRSSSGTKEPTDLNKLADEYFRLAYHGLRAKDKTFNAILLTDFDPTIGNVPIMPQDIGRVLLNLYNNAFYAVAEKKKQFPTGYEPEVSVSSRQCGGKFEISVKDNGNGIPQKVLDKIFQPFFTTKPTGQGTGLGLSLSYDIVKAHGGEIKVSTTEHEGTEFTIELPGRIEGI